MFGLGKKDNSEEEGFSESASDRNALDMQQEAELAKMLGGGSPQADAPVASQPQPQVQPQSQVPVQEPQSQVQPQPQVLASEPLAQQPQPQNIGYAERSSIIQESEEEAKIEQSANLIFEQLGDLGPLTQLLRDPTVSDILVNSPSSIYVERDGKLEKSNLVFDNDEQVRDIANRIIANLGREIDPERPYTDARLPDGSRVNIVTSPLALDGTVISIRKFPETVIRLKNMVESGCMTEDMAEFLRISGKSKVNIMIVGGTGAGKTTMLNAIAQHIGSDERIVTIEDAAELRLPIEHKVRLEAKPKNFMAKNPEHTEVSIRDLVMNALRMRPDRIIVGETRGPEAFDMIQAMNTGHDGSMSTVHANSPREALLRLENMINMAVPSLPSYAVKQRIASTLELIVMVARMDDGTRKVTYITEVTGMEGEMISAQDLFVFKEKGKDANEKIVGVFERSNFMPRFAQKCFKAGFKQQMARVFNREG